MAIMAVNKTNRFVRLSRVEADFCMIGNCKFCILYYLFLCLLVVETKGQIMDLDSIKSDYFKKYDIVFIGEQHKIQSTGRIEFKLINLINYDITKVCVEAPVDFNLPIEFLFKKEDTIHYNLSEFIQNGHSYELLGYLYNIHVMPKAIDVLKVENFYKEAIINIYKSKEVSGDLKNEISAFADIGIIKFPFRFKNMNKYGIFLDNFYKRRAEHCRVLGQDSTKVIEYFEALDAMLFAENDLNKDAPIFSKFREEFMLKMISKEIDKFLKVISINGLAHVSLGGKDTDIKNDNWTPLASMVKNSFPSKNICSIFLLNPEQDKFFRKDYPKEFAFICNNFKLNKTYIIDIDYPDSPFKNLIGKYTHIVVF